MIHPPFANSGLGTFVEQQARETVYYSQAWFDLIAQLYGYSIIPLITTDTHGQLTGFLPLCYMQSPFTGRRLASLPFCDYCPLLAVDDVSANDLIDQAIHLAQEKRVKYLELRTGINDVLAKRPDLMAGNLYVRWVKTLIADPDALWLSIDRSVREKIKKAQRLGVQVRMAEHREEMEHYYRLHLLTRSKKHGMPAQSRRYFFELWDTFASRGTMRLWLAEQQGIILAGEIALVSGSTVRFAYNASDQRYLYLAPNHLLMWAALNWASRQGYQVLDLGRTSCDNQGLMEFKRRWGAIKEPLPYYYYPHRAGLLATPEHSWKFRLLTGCWRRLPLQVTGPVGEHVYKHLG